MSWTEIVPQKASAAKIAVGISAFRMKPGSKMTIRLVLSTEAIGDDLNWLVTNGCRLMAGDGDDGGKIRLLAKGLIPLRPLSVAKRRETSPIYNVTLPGLMADTPHKVEQVDYEFNEVEEWLEARLPAWCHAPPRSSALRQTPRPVSVARPAPATGERKKPFSMVGQTR